MKSSSDDGRLLVFLKLRVGCIELCGDTLPREMIAQAQGIPVVGQNAAYRPTEVFLIMQPLINTILQRANHKQVSSVHLVVGELIEFSPETFQSMLRGTLAEDVQLHIRNIPAELQCMACFGRYHPINKKTLCPICGSVGAKVLSGEEFSIESIETDNE